jgi:hypothetical protein
MSDVHYRAALMKESMELSLTWLAVRLGLKELTVDEWSELRKRTAFVQEATARLKK